MITRMNMKDLAVGPHVVPAGHFLMLRSAVTSCTCTHDRSPYWSHRNAAFFPDPEAFKFGAAHAKFTHLLPGLSAGTPRSWTRESFWKGSLHSAAAGTSVRAVGWRSPRCSCAKCMQLLLIFTRHSFLIAFLGLFDIQALTAVVGEPSTLHLVGSQEPAGPFDVKFTRL